MLRAIGEGAPQYDRLDSRDSIVILFAGMIAGALTTILDVGLAIGTVLACAPNAYQAARFFPGIPFAPAAKKRITAPRSP
jgi:hypothetical protein